MYDPDTSDLTFTADGSRLLSESSLMASESNSSHHASVHDDLSLSELSIRSKDTILSKPFSLLSRPEPTTPPQQASTLDDADDADDDVRVGGEDEEVDEATAKKQNPKAREGKLQSDIFILRKLNSSFAAFNEALDATGSINDKIAKQLAQTDALLNKYAEMLYKSEDVARLIFDEEWEGADADEEQLERERLEAIERAQREEEERRLALQREQEKLEREEQERQAKEAKERAEQEKREKSAARGGSRGASRRGAATRGTVRGSTTSAVPPRSSGLESTSRIRPPSGLPTRRPSAAGRGTPPGAAARGIRKP